MSRGTYLTMTPRNVSATDVVETTATMYVLALCSTTCIRAACSQAALAHQAVEDPSASETHGAAGHLRATQVHGSGTLVVGAHLPSRDLDSTGHQGSGRVAIENGQIGRSDAHDSSQAPGDDHSATRQHPVQFRRCLIRSIR